MNVLLLILVAAIEAVVWLWRLRAGVGASALSSGLSAAAICGTRTLWLWAGVGVIMEGNGLLGAGVYCVTAGVVTGLAHRFGAPKKGNTWTATNRSRPLPPQPRSRA